MKPRSNDVTHLPTYGSGPVNPLWWGTLGFVVIEGLGFVFAAAAYFYLMSQGKSWPLGPQAGLLWPTLLFVLLVGSFLPNHLLKKAAMAKDLGKVRIGIVVMALIGVAAIGLRVFEFTTLNIRWDSNAYGSVVWFLVGLHTTHLVTDVGETIVMAVLLFIGPIDMRRFAEVEDNQDYWNFVILSWAAVYVVLYWVPRWLEVPA